MSADSAADRLFIDYCSKENNGLENCWGNVAISFDIILLSKDIGYLRLSFDSHFKLVQKIVTKQRKPKENE